MDSSEQSFRSDTVQNVASGSAMDRVVATKRLSNAVRLLIGAAGLLVLAFIAYWFLPSGKTQSIDGSRLGVATVKRDVFEDYLPLRARVTPLQTVYLGAVDGGRVEQIAVQDGTTVTKGQLLAILSNADLQLSTLARQTEVEQQLNNIRNQELALVQSDLANRRSIIQAELEFERTKRLYNLQKPLADRGFVTKREINDSRDAFNAAKRNLDELKFSASKENDLQYKQLKQLNLSALSLSSGLKIANNNLDQLNLRAPVSGQLTGFTIQLGQSIARGERIGQIDSAGQNKIVAVVDEFYINRVDIGQFITLDWNNRRYRLRVSKKSPQVRNGEFEIEAQFAEPEPSGLQRGQTISARLTLDDATSAIVFRNGAFYNDTGGAWVFVIAPDSRFAEKRMVRLGRRNAEFIEVLEGLQPGDKVIISSYVGLVDKDRLTFD
jgi:HlyD family secretion protein